MWEIQRVSLLQIPLLSAIKGAAGVMDKYLNEHKKLRLQKPKFT